ncbi:hypothetical protein D2962_10600 [Biomaibacter acetigenes]|uniref:SHOCT domain-containing protein n=1 Tax=Biomaibacter acetigenes TaxID=2316383 RepID=A0A3G2R9Q2_9FIRM|nr:hypothetical protein D2962_10600 [Biomaibacter acetigenes]
MNKHSVERVLESHALEILKERYARGEINEEEYKRRKKMLLT